MAALHGPRNESSDRQLTATSEGALEALCHFRGSVAAQLDPATEIAIRKWPRLKRQPRIFKCGSKLAHSGPYTIVTEYPTHLGFD